MYIRFFLFFFVLWLIYYVGFASASSNLSVPSYNSPRNTRECTDLLRTFHAFSHYTPVLLNILLAEEVGQCPLASSRQDIVHRAGVRPLQDKIFSHLLDLMILNSLIVSCENVTSLRIMLEHAARGRTPALSPTISHLEEASGHWLISSANRMLCHVCGVDCRKEASQYLSVILHKNSLLLVLECLLSTPCLHLRSLHVTSRATDLEDVCFIEAVVPENCGPTLSVCQPQPSFGFVHIQTVNISTPCCHIACVGLLRLSSLL
jgi:hypothetical protein